jgi:hypothetical protein
VEKVQQEKKKWECSQSRVWLGPGCHMMGTEICTLVDMTS